MIHKIVTNLKIINQQDMIIKLIKILIKIINLDYRILKMNNMIKKYKNNKMQIKQTAFKMIQTIIIQNILKISKIMKLINMKELGINNMLVILASIFIE